MTKNNEEISTRKTKISIGLPVYNGEKFIRKKLDSLLEQTFTDFEIIISDNCSNDQTSEICKEYASKENRIKYFRQIKNIGGWKNFGFILKKAKSEYFLWSAVDDIILPKFLEEVVQVLEYNKEIACSSSKMELFGKSTSELKKMQMIQESRIFLKIIWKILVIWITFLHQSIHHHSLQP